MARMCFIEQEVRNILRNNEPTRDDDMYLYFVYTKNKNVDFEKCFYNKGYRIERGIAPFESVSRARRKIQAKDITLLGTNKKERMEKEKEVREWATI